MGLEINQKEMLQLMRDFYISTGLLVVLFDDDQEVMLAYPTDATRFCNCMKSHPVTTQLCHQSDKKAFELCKESRKSVIYHCHAGLIESCTPIKSNGDIIGFIMFGQISDFQSRQLLNSHLQNYIASYPELKNENGWPPRDWSIDIPLKTTEQIQAAAKIMEACTLYMVLQNTVRVQRTNFITNMNAFLMEHLDEDLSVDAICRELGISRSKLYQACDTYLGKSIGTYVQELRLKHAKKLLLETKLPVTEISIKCGFNDYNYFCRVFKKEVGVSAGKYRLQE